MFTLSGVLDNFQLENYFLPVKMIPLQLQFGQDLYLFIFPTFTGICCETGTDFKGSNATCSFWSKFLQTLSTTLRILLRPQELAVFMLYNHNFCFFISKISIGLYYITCIYEIAIFYSSFHNCVDMYVRMPDRYTNIILQ